MRSANSSLPGSSYSVPSSRMMCTRAPSGSVERLRLPLSSALRSRSTSAVDWVKFTYIGSICCTTASSVTSPWPTSAPSVTSARPMRPEIGEVTDA